MLSRFFGRVLFAVSLIALSTSTAFAQMPAVRTTIMLECSGLPCVDVTLTTGSRLRLLIDTGNVNSVIDTSVAKQLGLTVSAVNGRDGKPIPGYGRSVLPGIKLGDTLLGDVKVLILDVQAYVKRDRMPAAEGSLAYTAFKDRILALDYRDKKVGVSKPLFTDPPCPKICGTLTTPTFGRHGPPIVVSTGFWVNDQPITAQIDTLFTGTMLIYPTSVEKLGLQNEARSTRKQFFKYTDDGVEMIEGTSASESFGKVVVRKKAPMYFATPSVHLPDGMFDATVGHGFFAGAALWLDFHGMKSWMTQP